MVRLRRPKQDPVNIEEDFDVSLHARVANFHPHCYVQSLAVAETKQFDEIYALEHHPVLRGDDEEEA